MRAMFIILYALITRTVQGWRRIMLVANSRINEPRRTRLQTAGSSEEITTRKFFLSTDVCINMIVIKF